MLSDVFKFLIREFSSIVSFFYNLPITITSNVSIPLGSLILSFFALGLIIFIFRGFFGFNKKE